jgi:hypothetical protein
LQVSARPFIVEVKGRVTGGVQHVLAINPFAQLSSSVSPAVMQAFVVAMAALVILGTLGDVLHKGSAAYFFRNMRKGKSQATREVGFGEKVGIAAQTLAVDVMAAGEFCNQKRRLAHLLTMYGFIAHVVATIVLVFYHATPASAAPAIWPWLWHIGAAMVAIGGYWFWFFIRVDVSAEGHTPFRFVRADLFVVSLTLAMTFALAWSFAQSSGSGLWATVFLGLYLLTSTVLFASVPWSKFSHMFFKPAAAFEKRMSKANGWALNLPKLTRDDPEQQQRHSMELLRDAPMNMGLGIKREKPNHY